MRCFVRMGLLALALLIRLRPMAAQIGSEPQPGLAQHSLISQDGDPGASEAISLRSLITELERNNPDIGAARRRYEAASKRPSQVGTLPEPRIQIVNFGVGHPISVLNDSNFAYQAIGASQEIPFPGKLALASEEARREAQSEFETYRGVGLDAIARLKVGYYEWFYLSKSVDILGKNRDLLERFEKIARARYAVGKGLQQDVLKAQVDVSGVVQQIELLKQRQASAEALIESLLGRRQTASLGIPAEVKRSTFDMDLTGLLKAVDQNSPRIRAQQHMVDSRAVGIERAAKEYRPDFNFNFQWQHTGSRFPDYYMVMAEVKLPVYFWRKQRYGSEEAQARFQAARQEYRSSVQEAEFTAKDQYLVAKTSERLLALYESGVIPQASLSVESNVAGYEVGHIDFLTLTNSLMSLLTFEMQYYEELAKHEQALARLEPLIGRQLIQP